MADEGPTKVQLRIKAGTAVTTAAVCAALLLYDWGPDNVFSGVRPAIKAVLNRVYGVRPPESPEASRKDSRGF